MLQTTGSEVSQRAITCCNQIGLKMKQSGNSVIEDVDHLLTAIVPVSRMAGKLENFESWISQASPKIKIIVVHDFQDDATGKELRTIIGSNIHIKFIEGIFGSPGAARNAGLEFADTLWTVFWDSDDLPNTTETLEILGRGSDQKDVIVTSFDVRSLGVDGNVRKSFTPNGSIGKKLRYLASDPGIWRVLFRTEIVSNLTFTDLRMGEDVLFLARALDNSKYFVFENVITYSYFRNVPGQLTSNARNIRDLLEVLAQINYKSLNKFVEVNFLLTLIAKQSISLIKHKVGIFEVISNVVRIKAVRRHPYYFMKSLFRVTLRYVYEKLISLFQ